MLTRPNINILLHGCVGLVCDTKQPDTRKNLVRNWSPPPSKYWYVPVFMVTILIFTTLITYNLTKIIHSTVACLTSSGGIKFIVANSWNGSGSRMFSTANAEPTSLITPALICPRHHKCLDFTILAILHTKHKSQSSLLCSNLNLTHDHSWVQIFFAFSLCLTESINKSKQLHKVYYQVCYKLMRFQEKNTYETYCVGTISSACVYCVNQKTRVKLVLQLQAA